MCNRQKNNSSLPINYLEQSVPVEFLQVNSDKQKGKLEDMKSKYLIVVNVTHNTNSIQFLSWHYG